MPGTIRVTEAHICPVYNIDVQMFPYLQGRLYAFLRTFRPPKLLYRTKTHPHVGASKMGRISMDWSKRHPDPTPVQSKNHCVPVGFASS
jgi:hypothetical protein